jgi:hypothetical protein
MMGLLKIFQPFRQWPEPQSSLGIDPVWSDLDRSEREARRRHKRVEPIRRAKAERVHQLLRGRA